MTTEKAWAIVFLAISGIMYLILFLLVSVPSLKKKNLSRFMFYMLALYLPLAFYSCYKSPCWFNGNHGPQCKEKTTK